MAKKIYISARGRTKNASKMYIGIDDKSKHVCAAYVGDNNGKARKFYEEAYTPPSVLTFAGRRIYRHRRLPGSVIEYNQFGTAKRLFVADAQYRGASMWATVSMGITGLAMWSNEYYPTCTGNILNSRDGYADLSEVANLASYESKLTDDHFKAALEPTLAPVIQTAKQATDIMISAGFCPAAQFCREQNVGIELQLPNIYQLLVMYASGDFIDQLDPTVASFKANALGKYDDNPYRCRVANYSTIWASMGYSDSNACYLHCVGYTDGATKTRVSGIIPVAEL